MNTKALQEARVWAREEMERCVRFWLEKWMDKEH